MSTDTPVSGPSIPEKGWENPFAPGTWLHDHMEKVYREERDILILWDDLRGRRGTGKTIGCLDLGSGLDQTAEGLTYEKTSLRPEEIRNAYTEQPLKSALILDEGEWGISNRSAMTKTNQVLREIMSMGRVEQKYVIINTPIKGFIDKDIQKLADVWISNVRRGLAIVHEFKWEPYSEKLLTPKRQWLKFNDIPHDDPLREVYNNLTREKRRIIRGSEGGSFITEEDHEEKLAKAREQVRREQRNEDIRSILRHPEHQESPDINQRTVGEAIGLEQPTVSRILDDDGDE